MKDIDHEDTIVHKWTKCDKSMKLIFWAKFSK